MVTKYGLIYDWDMIMLKKSEKSVITNPKFWQKMKAPNVVIVQALKNVQAFIGYDSRDLRTSQARA